MQAIISRPVEQTHFDSLVSEGMWPLMARIFAARNIAHIAELETSLSQLPSHHLLMGAREAAIILADAIDAQKSILIVGDYDADGATATATGVRGLRMMGGKVDYLVPNRFEYGYGLTPEIVDLAATRKPDLIVTVDNGIASIAGVAHANELGIPVLVTDHHLPGDELPAALCIVNPNQPGCSFPSKNLAGVGVMFYVLIAVRAEFRQRGKEVKINIACLLDLVALGTVADVVKLDEINRVLVSNGLWRMKHASGSSMGIAAIMSSAGKSIDRVAAYDLGFVVGPRLNAAGRLDDMSVGIQCLLSESWDEACKIGTKLDALNKERRQIEAEMQTSALELMSALETDSSSWRDNHSIVLHHPDWHQGVIGIVASRLKDRYHRPTIVFASTSDGYAKGSGRSIPGLHLRDALDLVAKRHPLLISKFGGHSASAGLTIKLDDMNAFRLAFNEVARELLSTEDLNKTIETDGQLGIDDMTLDVAKDIAGQIWGQGFPEPVFDGHFRVISQRILAEKHSKLRVALTDISGAHKELDAIYFSSTEPLPATVRAAYKLSINEWNDNVNLQLQFLHVIPA